MAPSSRPAVFLAPGASFSLGTSAPLRAYAPGYGDALPAVDDSLLPSEGDEEILDGQRVKVMPAKEPHATANSDLAALLHAYAAADYRVAVDMLTRTGSQDEFAPDASVYPRAPDPATKGRQLEELAFEIVSEQSWNVPTRKAAKLWQRGVRRILAIGLEPWQVCEWEGPEQRWVQLDPQGQLDDRCLVRPLRWEALRDVALQDDALLAALQAKGNRALEQLRQQERDEGKKLGLDEGKRLGTSATCLALC
jgi:Uma2 family endonuclease